jgi:hypothetical protein
MVTPEQQKKRHPTPKGARQRSRYHPNSAHEHILKGSVFSTISVLRKNLVHRSGVTSGRRLSLRTINASAQLLGEDLPAGFEQSALSNRRLSGERYLVVLVPSSNTYKHHTDMFYL